MGYPSKGRLDGAAPLPDGEGRILKSTPRKMWATRRTVAILDALFRAWSRIEPYADPILVGNLSLRQGGNLRPHHTHQSGRDVDLGYPQIRVEGEVYNWREMDRRNLDRRRTWRLLHLLRATREVEVVLMDRSIQKLLFEYARDKNLMTDEQLAEWLEYPQKAAENMPFVQHAEGHIDHIHVRFRCGAEEGCQSRRDDGVLE